MKPNYFALFLLNFVSLAVFVGLYNHSFDRQTTVSADTSDVCLRSPPKEKLWSSSFQTDRWLEHWEPLASKSWGMENLDIKQNTSQKFTYTLRVYYPANSASPTVKKKQGTPLGGGQFYAKLNLPPQDSLTLSYYVRFSANFDFVKGGKLPGLFGGSGNNGGNIPDGTDGFSTRYMWRKQGYGEIYAYLPTSQNHGTSIGRETWQFVPGKWYHLQQKIILNQPNQQNGSICVWVDGQKVIEQNRLVFRTTKTLKIDGILFSTFFGGDDSSWATRKNVYADFADFSVY